jgi:pyrophosphate--fructose-6-phosphate 1-phosphotransferase
MVSKDTLSDLRKAYKPKIPDSLFEPLRAEKQEGIKPIDPTAQSFFLNTAGQSKVILKKGGQTVPRPIRVGVLFSGGQASGGHNVICGLFDVLKKLHRESTLVGFIGGPGGLVKGESVELTEQKLSFFRNQGGFDLIGSGRTKIETDEQFASSAKVATTLNLDGLVIIGGDDSNTNAALLAEYFVKNKIQTNVIGVPKTIDGDLKNEEIEISFGFDTATKTFSDTIGNIARDALSAKKYFFFVKLMGRSASHIALECALQTHPNLCLIGEEIEKNKTTLKELVDHVLELINKRQKSGKNYGVILIPEGIIEFLPDVRALISELNPLAGKEIEEVKEKLSRGALQTFLQIPDVIKKQLLLDRDPHGNVQVSKIETDQLLIEAIKQRELAAKLNAQGHFCGYEGRSCLPSNFDANYCYTLGGCAAHLLFLGYTGYMAVVQNLKDSPKNWKLAGVPLVGMIHLENRKGKQVPVIKKALVDLQGAPFQRFAKERKGWEVEESFRYPGPMQFFGPEAITDAITLTLQLERGN